MPLISSNTLHMLFYCKKRFIFRLRDALSKEICLVKQAMEWGEEGTPPQHWDELVEVRGSLCDLRHNLRMLIDKNITLFKQLCKNQWSQCTFKFFEKS